MQFFKDNKFMVFVICFMILFGCAALQEKFNPWYENPDCSLFSDLDPQVTDGYIYDGLKDKNPCALEHGLIFAAEGTIQLTSKDAQDIYNWAEKAREYIDEGLNGEKFIGLVSDGLGGLLGNIVGKFTLWVGDGLRLIPKTAIIKGGDAQVIDYLLSKVQDKMSKIMEMPTIKVTGGVEVQLKF